jgi:hypothetical protein
MDFLHGIRTISAGKGLLHVLEQRVLDAEKTAHVFWSYLRALAYEPANRANAGSVERSLSFVQ